MYIQIFSAFDVIDEYPFVFHQEQPSLFVLIQILSVEKLESSMAEGRHSSRCEEQEHFICAQVK